MKIKKLKSFLKRMIPRKIKYLVGGLKIRIYKINTYILRQPQSFNNLRSIDSKFVVRKISWDDTEKLEMAYNSYVPEAFKRKIPPRLNTDEWIGLAVIDTTCNKVAYLAWIISKSIKYLEEFGITLKDKQFLLKDGLCFPEYRHQGLHTRMEQERINYCIKKGANEIFIQIHASSKKGINSVIENGYQLFRQNYVIQWRIFNVYRELYSFLKSPFRKVVK